jgi:BASS family bile acid:Na+ symporter
MTMAAIIILVAKLSIVGIVFALGLRSKPEDITTLLARPGVLVRAFVAINLVVPAFAILAVKLLPLRTEVAVALIALSLSPVPPLLPRKTANAEGDRSFAVGLLVVFAVLSIVWVPAAVHLVGLIFAHPLGMSPTKIAWIVATLIVLPLALGILVRRLAADFAQRIEPIVALAALIVLGLVAVLILAGSAKGIIAQIGDGTIALMAAFVIVGLAAGHMLGGPDPRERTDLALAAASRHPGIALATAQIAFPDVKAVTALVALYLIVGGVFALRYINWRAKTDRGAASDVAPPG